MPGRPLHPPVWWAATFEFDRSEELIEAARAATRRFETGTPAEPIYTRWDNPTVRAVEEAVAALENGEDALAFASGMAAISTALLAFLRQGDHVLALSTLYGGTVELLTDVLPRWGIQVTCVDPDDLTPDRIRETRPQVVYVESPTNPTLRVLPLRPIAEAAHQVGALAVIDNTFATPVLQQPLMFGFDLVIHSATKALGGHHDVMGGFVVGLRHWLRPIWDMRKLLGGVMDPMVAFMVYRGLKTLTFRVLHQCETALQVARFLADHPRVRQVFYPGLPTHPDHAVARAQMRAFGTMVSFVYDGDIAATQALIDRLTVFHRAASLGGVDSLVTQPVTTSHLHVDDTLRQRLGIGPNLVRLSIGIEPAETLIADLRQALEAS
jgi:cystathionine beta-lyase/cystathionine gamma-synthase